MIVAAKWNSIWFKIEIRAAVLFVFPLWQKWSDSLRTVQSILTLRKLDFLSYRIGYDRSDCFPFDFPFLSKSKGKLSLRSYPIQYERNRKYSFLSVLVFIISLYEFQKETDQTYSKHFIALPRQSFHTVLLSK